MRNVLGYYYSVIIPPSPLHPFLMLMKGPYRHTYSNIVPRLMQEIFELKLLLWALIVIESNFQNLDAFFLSKLVVDLLWMRPE